jgi:23S rRNA pseudouridine2605 synthase
MHRRDSRRPRLPGAARGTVRLDRALSKLGIASRSAAKRSIEAGAVTVDGRVVTDPARLVIPEKAVIEIGGRQQRAAPWRTIVFNKPRGVVTTRRDPQGRRTVFDVLGEHGHSLVAAGRLDLASTGLLILTTDTQLAAWLTDPGNEVVRGYIVTAKGAVSDASAKAMTRGLNGMRARSVEILKRSARESHLAIELTEGRNREIRRLLAAVGHDVTRLLRVRFGAIELGPLQPAEWREIRREEIAAAFPGFGR